MYAQGELLSIDIDELGVRPPNWTDTNKDADDPTNDFFRTGKTNEITVYSVELLFTQNGKKSTTNEDDPSMSDDEYSHDYEIDPETGEKIFHNSGITSNDSASTPNDKWIEEYLSTIEASSNQLLLPPPPTTIDNSQIMLDNIQMSLFDNIFDRTDSDWFSSIFNFGEDSNNNMFTNPSISNEFIDVNEQKLDDNKISPEFESSSSNSVSSVDMNTIATTNDLSVLINPSTILVDDEYSNASELTLLDAKLEKIDSDGDSTSQITLRRISARSNSQRQQDEEALHQYNIPLGLNEITQSSTDEYNRLLLNLSHLTSEQMHIIKDIRRRGKNKIAAQNCRKRKATGVEFLVEEVDELKRVKRELEERKLAFQQQILETRRQYEYLHRQVLPDRQLPPAILVK